jgi:hypothetical protein
MEREMRVASMATFFVSGLRSVFIAAAIELFPIAAISQGASVVRIGYTEISIPAYKDMVNTKPGAEVIYNKIASGKRENDVLGIYVPEKIYLQSKSGRTPSLITTYVVFMNAKDTEARLINESNFSSIASDFTRDIKGSMKKDASAAQMQDYAKKSKLSFVDIDGEAIISKSNKHVSGAMDGQLKTEGGNVINIHLVRTLMLVSKKLLMMDYITYNPSKETVSASARYVSEWAKSIDVANP